MSHKSLVVGLPFGLFHLPMTLLGDFGPTIWTTSNSLIFLPWQHTLRRGSESSDDCGFHTDRWDSQPFDDYEYHVLSLAYDPSPFYICMYEIESSIGCWCLAKCWVSQHCLIRCGTDRIYINPTPTFQHWTLLGSSAP